MGLFRTAWLGIVAISALATAMASGPDYQTTGVRPDNLPVMATQRKARLTFPMAWSPQVTNLVAWRKSPSSGS